VNVRRGRITADRAKEFLAQLAMLNFRIDRAPSTLDFARLQTLVERHGLTAYDAAYLDLAIRLSLPLASIDGDPRRAAIVEGIEALGKLDPNKAASALGIRRENGRSTLP